MEVLKPESFKPKRLRLGAVASACAPKVVLEAMTSVLHTAARPETLLSREREELAFPDPGLPDGLHPLFAATLAEGGWGGSGGGRGGVWMLVRDPCAFTDQCKLSDQQRGPASLDD